MFLNQKYLSVGWFRSVPPHLYRKKSTKQYLKPSISPHHISESKFVRWISSRNSYFMSVLLLNAECVYLSLIFGNELPVFEVQIISSIELSNNCAMPVLFCLKLGANVKYISDLAPTSPFVKPDGWFKHFSWSVFPCHSHNSLRDITHTLHPVTQHFAPKLFKQYEQCQQWMQICKQCKQFIAQCYLHLWRYLYRTQVRSLPCLVSHSGTH